MGLIDKIIEEGELIYDKCLVLDAINAKLRIISIYLIEN